MFVVITLIVLFLTASGLMAAVDAAMMSVTEPEIHELLGKGRRGARQLQAAHRQLTRTVVVVVILTNLINVVGPIIVSQQAVSLFGTDVLTWITITLTLGTIVCSEIIPKSLGNRYATLIGRYAAAPVRGVQLLLFPLVVLLDWFSGLFTRGTRRIGTEEQIRSLTNLGRKAGYIEKDEGRLIHRAFILNDRMAADIMTPLEKSSGCGATRRSARPFSNCDTRGIPESLCSAKVAMRSLELRWFAVFWKLRCTSRTKYSFRKSSCPLCLSTVADNRTNCSRSSCKRTLILRLCRQKGEQWASSHWKTFWKNSSVKSATNMTSRYAERPSIVQPVTH